MAIRIKTRPKWQVEVDQKRERLEEILALRTSLDHEERTLRDDLLALFTEHAPDVSTYETDEKALPITIVRPQPKPIIDPDRLREALTLRVWNKITTRRVDNVLVAKAVQRGEITQATLAACSTDSTPRAPYVKVA